MRNVFVIILFTSAVSKELTDNLLDRLISSLDNKAELDNTVLGKSTMRMTQPSAAKAAKVPSLMMQPRTNMFSQVPHLPYRQQYLQPYHQPAPQGDSPSMRSSIVPQGHFTDNEHTFHYGHGVDFEYKEVAPSDVLQLMQEGWILLDVRQDEQVQRAEVAGAVEVPLYVLKNDKSLMGLYQESIAFGLGGWWMGGRPMKENVDFVRQVERKITKSAPGVIAVCQSGLRSKQALKELHAAGYQRLALVKGGLNAVRHNELPCVEEGCRLDLAGSGAVAGMLGWHAN